MAMTDEELLKEITRRGVQAEIERLMRLLDGLGGVNHLSDRLDSPKGGRAAKARGRGRKPMTASQRKEVSRRMKAHWAAKRKQKGA